MSRCHQIKNARENGGQQDKDVLGRRDCQIIICLLNSWSVSIITEGECFPGVFTSISGKWNNCDTREKTTGGIDFSDAYQNIVSVMNQDIKWQHSKLVLGVFVLFLNPSKQYLCSSVAAGCSLDEASCLLLEISPSSVTLSQSSLSLTCVNQPTYRRAKNQHRGDVHWQARHLVCGVWETPSGEQFRCVFLLKRWNHRQKLSSAIKGNNRGR